MEGEPARCRFRLLSGVEGPDKLVFTDIWSLGHLIGTRHEPNCPFVPNRCHTPVWGKFGIRVKSGHSALVSLRGFVWQSRRRMEAESVACLLPRLPIIQGACGTPANE
jgi:hypothetical protein